MFFNKKILIDGKEVPYLLKTLETSLNQDSYLIKLRILINDSVDKNKNTFFLINDWLNKKVDISIECDGEGITKTFKDCIIVKPIVINENPDEEIQLIFHSESINFN